MSEALVMPDMIVAGGTLLTSDPSRPYIHEGWIVIDNGRIQSIQDELNCDCAVDFGFDFLDFRFSISSSGTGFRFVSL